MITGIRGRVRFIDMSALVISVGPVDVRVSVPPSMTSGVVTSQEIELHTHLHVREDQLALFGFSSPDERELFELLLGVSGVGPKMAMAVVGGLGPGEVRRAIANADTESLARAPGVGARAASRIVSDLKGKIPPSPLAPGTDQAGVPGTVLAALIAMGYPPTEARRAVEQVGTVESPEEALRAALGILAD